MELNRSKKRAILILVDVAIILSSGFLSNFFLKDNFHLQLTPEVLYMVGACTLYLISGSVSKVFSIINRFTDYRALAKVGLSLFISFFMMYLSLLIWNVEISERFVCLMAVFSSLFLVGIRLSWRSYNEYLNHKHSRGLVKEKKKTLVVGAGVGASLFLKTALTTARDLDIVGIVDRDLSKQNQILHGIRVIGQDKEIPKIVNEFEIVQIVIAIPSLSASDYERILKLCQQANVKIVAVPRYEDVLVGNVTVNKLREIDISDLLGRKEVQLDQSSLISNLKGKTILVTGAGGSIGSELCRQITKFEPARILLLGHGENSIYLIHRELTVQYGHLIEFIPIIADIQDRERMFSIMEQYHPDRVYHAAAHKHVPLMEANPGEAFKNNVFGTRNVAEAALATGVPKFVMISTDKAVNPPNVMGATKRLAEMIVTSLNGKGKTLFSAVRFGNVLGSRGSVVPLFKEQIAKGGPVTVTDFRMTRYFMTIPEASRLVLQASTLMNGGEVFVLDMGDPVKIVDLAKKMIRLSGYNQSEIKIVETGIRPGEKLYEELLSSKEKVTDQVFDHIFVGRVCSMENEAVNAFIAEIEGLKGTDLKEELIRFAQQ